MTTAHQLIDDPETRKAVFGTSGEGQTLEAAGAFAAVALGEVEADEIPLDRVLDRKGCRSPDPHMRIPDSAACEDAWRMQVDLRAESVAANAEVDEDVFDVRDFDDAHRIAEGMLENDVRERFAYLVARRAERALTEPDDPRAPKTAAHFVGLCDAIGHAEDYLKPFKTETEDRVGEIRERVLSDVRPPTQGDGPTGADEAFGWDEDSVIVFDELAGRYELVDRIEWEEKFGDGLDGPGRAA